MCSSPDPDAGAFEHRDEHFEIRGRFNVPHSPQGRPVIFQAGDSEEGRKFAAATADAIFTRHSGHHAGQAFYSDVKGRLAAYGRRPEDLVVLPAATFVLADTDAEAEELSRHVREQQVSGPTAIKLLEHVWNRDLSAYDPDGPLPEVEPRVGETTIAPGRASVRMNQDPLGTARQWRQLATEKKLSIRQLMIEVSARQSFVGCAASIAEKMDQFVQDQVCDGFILVPHITPGGLDEFADRVVPLLQERGVFRAEYEGATLRDHLGLARWPTDGSGHAPPGATRSAPVTHSGPALGARPRAGGLRGDARPTPCGTPSTWPSGRSASATSATGLPNIISITAWPVPRPAIMVGLAAAATGRSGSGRAESSWDTGLLSRWSRSSACSTWLSRVGSTSGWDGRRHAPTPS